MVVYKEKDLKKLKVNQLRQIGKEKGLLRVDQNKKNELIDRILKGKQLTDESKSVLLELAQNKGILANATMSKGTILQKIQNPKLKDLNEDRLRKVAEKRGVRLRGRMTKEKIIDRINNPIKYYTIESLKKVAADNNIIVDRNIKRDDLIEQLKDRKLLDIPLEPIVESNLGVKFSDAPLKLIRAAKRKARNAREDLANYKNYIKSLNNESLTSKRFKKLLKQVEKKEIKAKEEHDRIFTVREGQKALKNFAKVYVIDGTAVYEPREFLAEVRVPITRILRTNKETKVKMLFTCNMERDVLDYGTVIKPFYFYSHNEINLRATDENEIYDKMIDRIEEEIQKLEAAEGTGWRLHSVIKLELFTVEWCL